MFSAREGLVRLNPIDQPRVRDAVNRIALSGTFSSNRHYVECIRFVVEEVLAGRGGELKQAKIAKKKFDGAKKSNARAEFGRIRGKLLKYYSKEGRNDPVWIDIPPGGFIPTFWLRALSDEEKIEQVGSESADRIVQLTTERLQLLKGTKYLADCYIKRKSIEENIYAWLEHGETSGLIVVSESGAGKTSLLCRIAEQVCTKDDYVVYFISGSDLGGSAETLFQRMISDFGLEAQSFQGLLDRWRAQTDGRQVVVVFDAINEAPNVTRAMCEFLELVQVATSGHRKGSVPELRILASIRSDSLLAFKTNPLHANRHLLAQFYEEAGGNSPSGDPRPYLTLMRFTETEAAEAFGLYDELGISITQVRISSNVSKTRVALSWVSLPNETRETIRHPILMRLFFVTNAGGVPISSGRELWKRFLKDVFDRSPSLAQASRLIAELCMGSGVQEPYHDVAFRFSELWEENALLDYTLSPKDTREIIQSLVEEGILRKNLDGTLAWGSDLLAEEVFCYSIRQHVLLETHSGFRSALFLTPTDRLRGALALIAEDLRLSQRWTELAQFSSTELGISSLERMLGRWISESESAHVIRGRLSELLKELESNSLRYRLCTSLAAHLNYRHRFEEALRIHALAGSFVGTDIERARAMVFEAGVEARNNPHFGNYEDYDYAIAVGLKSGEAQFVSETYLAKSQTALHRQDWDKFDEAIEHAEALASLLGHRNTISHLLQIHGEADVQRGRIPEAVTRLEEARRQFVESYDSSGLCAATGWLGLAKCRLGNLDEGMSLVRAALRTECDSLRSREGSAKWLHFLGEVFAESGDWKRAMECLLLSRSLREEIDHVDVASTMKWLEKLRAGMGEKDYTVAESRFDPGAGEFSQYAFVWGFGAFQHSAVNPILGRLGQTWERRGVYNPAAYADEKGVYLFYRAEGVPLPEMDQSVSVVGFASSKDGRTFERRAEPVLQPTEPWELPGGCEDPRVVRIDNSFHMTYTAYDGIARLASATSEDMISWTKKGLMLTDEQWPEYFTDANWEVLTRGRSGRVKPTKGWSKSGALLPKRIGDRYWMYFGDTHIWAAYSSDLKRWHVIPEPVLSPRIDYFDSYLVEPGPPPLILPEGIWLAYNGATEVDQDRGILRYACGQALFALDDPTRLLRRCPRPILEFPAASQSYNRVDHQVVFCEGIVNYKGEWLLYYGLGDEAIGVAAGKRSGDQ